VESLKPFLLCVVLGGVAYGVYVALNHAPPPEPPPAATGSWSKPAGSEAGPPTTANANRAEGPRNAPTTTSSPSAQSAPSAETGISSLPFGIGAANSHPSASDPSASNDPARATSADDGLPTANSDRPSEPPGQSAIDSQARDRHEYESSMRSAQTLLANGKLVESLRELSRWYENPAVPPEDQSHLAELLGQLAGTVIYSRQNFLAPPYVVRPGDTLPTIAQQYQVPWQLLAKINGIEDPNRLLPGQELKVVRGPFHAQLDARHEWLALFVDELYAGRFRVQITGDLIKPNGAYPVVKFASDHPSNSSHAPYITVGGDLAIQIPGGSTPAPGTVGIAPRDMGDVFDILSERSQVTIRR